MKPIQRSRLRLFAGKRYFIWKRYLKWCTGRSKIARQRTDETLSYAAMTHATPLLRSLRNVDMVLQYNKITNLRLAIAKLDGLVVQPGETFPTGEVLVSPLSEKGIWRVWCCIMVVFIPGVGGGLCQLSNLIYWMALHTPLTVMERHRHSYDVFPDEQRTQPFGSGATCSYNYLDLQLKNNTAQTYQLKLWLDDSHLHGEWRCNEQALYDYEVYESDHRISLEPWGGYIRSNKISRKVYTRSGELIGDEAVTDNYALMMYFPLLHG